jgi:hypothetical protein
MIDAIDELVSRSKNCRELRDFHEAHRDHPELLDFLVREIQLRLDAGFTAFSYNSLWEYARWKIDMEKGPEQTFMMNDHDAPFYGRAITILHPEFNGSVEFREAKADEVFGLRIEPVPEKRPKNYARRLQWADGTSLEKGWRPTVPHVVGPVATKQDIHEKKSGAVSTRVFTEEVKRHGS